ncbi:MAG: PRC-barrel domain-containing protein [Methylovirgula sp.]
MLWNLSAIKGYAIKAKDGELGSVNDLLFDDTNWLVRWLVVDTGHWLSGRKVLLPPSVVRRTDPKERDVSVDLTMQQVKDSPDIDTDRPVSRQIETSIYDFYGWSPYWGNGLFTDTYGYVDGDMTAAPRLGSPQRRADIAEIERSDDDPHLRSISEVTGYHIQASDGEIGHVADFLLEDADWSIRYLVVDTKNWWPGKKVLISPRLAPEIDWIDQLVKLEMNREQVKDSPTYDPSAVADQAYDAEFLTYYGIRWIDK